MESLIFVSANIEDKDDEAIAVLVRAFGRVKDDSPVTIERTVEDIRSPISTIEKPRG